MVPISDPTRYGPSSLPEMSQWGFKITYFLGKQRYMYNPYSYTYRYLYTYDTLFFNLHTHILSIKLQCSFSGLSQKGLPSVLDVYGLPKTQEGKFDVEYGWNYSPNPS